MQVMDNASYHHQLNTAYFPEGKTVGNASKGLNAHVLRLAGCTHISVSRRRSDGSMVDNFMFEVPAEEPISWRNHRTGVQGAKAPTTGDEGTVYARAKKNTGGPTSKELATATHKWLKEHKPEALDSKVEKLFREKGWKIIWTPPYCPKFQPIELVWGVGKQRAGTLYKKGRSMNTTQRHLRRDWYGGKGKGSQRFKRCNVRGCWETAEREINAWIGKDKVHNKDGVEGTLRDLVGADLWTETDENCCDIDDMEDDFDDRDREFERDNGGIDFDEFEVEVQVAAAQLGGHDDPP